MRYWWIQKTVFFLVPQTAVVGAPISNPSLNAVSFVCIKDSGKNKNGHGSVFFSLEYVRCE